MENSIPLGKLLGVGLFLHISTPLFVLFITTDFALNAPAALSLLIHFSLALFVHLLAQFTALLYFKRPAVTHPTGKSIGSIFSDSFSLLSIYPHGAYWRPRIAELRIHQLSQSNALYFCLAGVAANAAVALYALAFGFGLELPPLSLAIAKNQLFWCHAALALCNLIPCPPFGLGLYIFHHKPLWREHCIQITQIMALIGIFAFALAQMFALVIAGFFVHNFALKALLFTFAQKQGANRKVRSVMSKIDELPSLVSNSSAQSAFGLLEKSLIDFFPVKQGSKVLGVVERSTLLSTIVQGKGNTPISELMNQDVPVVDAEAPLSSLVSEFCPVDEQICLVNSKEQTIGILAVSKCAYVLSVQKMHTDHEEEDLM